MKIQELLAAIPLPWDPPRPEAGTPLLDCGLLCVLSRRLTPTQAEKTLRALRRGYEDWNELRISQIQEFQGLVASKSIQTRLAVAEDVRSFLQEVFQRNHGFDLEHLREDPAEAGKHLAEYTFLGAGAAHFLLWVAGDGAVPVSIGLIRVLDRTGGMKRTSSVRKAQATLDPLVPAEERAGFGLRLGMVVQHWCDSKRPTCWECPLCELCPYGKKVHRDWKAQQKRLAAQREKDEERRRREEERQRQRAAAEEKRKAAERARQAAKLERTRKQEEARRAREEEKRKAAARREAERKKAAAKKAAAKKAAAKKAAAKKAAAKKAAAKKAAAKKAAAKKAAAKKAAAKKAAAKKAAAKKKAAPRKKPAKKKPAKRKPATGKSTKAATRKKPTKKRGSTRGRATTKKPALRKPAARKKKSRTRRR